MRGRKRHLSVDADGMLLAAVVLPASVQDGHGAVPLLGELRRRHAQLKRLWGDGLYRGPQVAAALAEALPDCRIEVVSRPPGAGRGFAALPRRWVIERSFAWLSRNRRLGRDHERYAHTVLAFVLLAMSRIMLRRLARTADQQAVDQQP